MSFKISMLMKCNVLTVLGSAANAQGHVKNDAVVP